MTNKELLNIIEEEIQAFLDERCQKGYETHPTTKTKKMYGKTYRNCVKADEGKKKKTDYSKEKKSGLHGWFSRAGGKGKSKGWVDCNTCRKGKGGCKTCKSCGRGSDEKRAKYPHCRPTPSDCGTSKKSGKKSKAGKKG